MSFNFLGDTHELSEQTKTRHRDGGLKQCPRLDREQRLPGVPDKQAPKSPLVLQVPMIVSPAATSQISNGDLAFL